MPPQIWTVRYDGFCLIAEDENSETGTDERWSKLGPPKDLRKRRSDGGTGLGGKAARPRTRPCQPRHSSRTRWGRLWSGPQAVGFCRPGLGVPGRGRNCTPLLFSVWTCWRVVAGLVASTPGVCWLSGSLDHCEATRQRTLKVACEGGAIDAFAWTNGVGGNCNAT